MNPAIVPVDFFSFAAMQPDLAHNLDTPATDENAKLRELQANVRDQDELERELGRQV